MVSGVAYATTSHTCGLLESAFVMQDVGVPQQFKANRRIYYRQFMPSFPFGDSTRSPAMAHPATCQPFPSRPVAHVSLRNEACERASNLLHCCANHTAELAAEGSVVLHHLISPRESGTGYSPASSQQDVWTRPNVTHLNCEPVRIASYFWKNAGEGVGGISGPEVAGKSQKS